MLRWGIRSGFFMIGSGIGCRASEVKVMILRERNVYKAHREMSIKLRENQRARDCILNKKRKANVYRGYGVNIE